MDQQDINALLAAALESAETRLTAQETRLTDQEEIIELLVGRIEALTYQMDGVLGEAQNARLHYASARKKLGLTVDLSGGSLIGERFGLPD